MKEWFRRGVDPRTAAGPVLLVLLWLAAAVPAVGDATDLVRARTTADQLGPAVDTAVVELQEERRLSSAHQAGGDPSALNAQRVRTDRARAALDEAAEGWRSNLYTADAAASVDEMRRRLGELGGIRGQVDSQRAGRGDVLAAYSRVIDAGLGAPWLPSGAAPVALGRAREALAEQDALLRVALATPAGVSDADRLRLADLIGARHARLADAGAAGRDQGLAAVEEKLLLGRIPPPAPAEWAAAADPIHAGLRAAEVDAVRRVTEATPGAVAAVIYAGLVAGLGLVAVIGVLLLARRTAAARPVAAPAGAAAGGADSPRNLEAVLLDLHRRSQRLIHRQLRLLDAMERRQSNDETLGDLFRADHLATRIRRNVEKAIILAGGMPGRRWRRPVPLVEVVRGAAAEVTDYVRVATSQVEPAALAGPAVTDVAHLLAELIDNATTYSPSETRVRVSGCRNDDGRYTVTVTDAGPGMSDLDLATAHEVMSAPEPPADGVWWGFYAVGRFAARQNITVRVERGAAGGVVAEVVLPSELITDPGDGGPGPDAPPLSRVARMRARINEMSEASTTTVDLPVVSVERTQ